MGSTMIHPTTGLHALGMVGGRPVWPIMGCAPDDPPVGDQGQQLPSSDGQQDGQRPDGVSEEEWAALGDPGRRALERERRTAREERRTRERLEQQLRERDQQQQNPPAPPAPETPGKGGKPGDTDVQALIDRAVQAALRPVLEQQAATAAERIRDRAQAIAAQVLHNPADAAVHLDLTTMVTASGDPDEQAIRDGLARLIEDRPYLAKPRDGRRAAEGSGQGAGSSTSQTLQQRTQAVLERMKTYG